MRLHPSIDHARETFWTVAAVLVVLGLLAATVWTVAGAYTP